MGKKNNGPLKTLTMSAAAAAAALLLAASAHAFQVPAALRTRPGFVRRTALAAGFGPPKPCKPAKPAPAGKKRAKLAEPQWDPGWKAVQDAKERVKAKKAADEARRAAEDAVVGKQFQETVAQVLCRRERAYARARARARMRRRCQCAGRGVPLPRLVAARLFARPAPTRCPCALRDSGRTGMRCGGRRDAGSAQRQRLLCQGQLSRRGGMRHDARRCAHSPVP